jgi:hemolysin III
VPTSASWLVSAVTVRDVAARTAVVTAAEPSPTPGHDGPVAGGGFRGIVRLTGTDLCPSWRGRVHLAALAVCLPAGVVLLLHRPSPAAACFLAGLVAMYTVSSAYHLMPCRPEVRRLLRRADHATIYLCIAGSYTPLCSVALPGLTGHLLLAVAWAGAAGGVVLKVVHFERRPRLGSCGYFVLGWMVVAVLPQVAGRLDPAQVALLLGTGLAYTGGAGVLFARWPDPSPDRFGYHELWHLAVVAASACYFCLVWSLPAAG